MKIIFYTVNFLNIENPNCHQSKMKKSVKGRRSFQMFFFVWKILDRRRQIVTTDVGSKTFIANFMCRTYWYRTRAFTIKISPSPSFADGFTLQWGHFGYRRASKEDAYHNCNSNINISVR
jgi:hypothetical protein